MKYLAYNKGAIGEVFKESFFKTKKSPNMNKIDPWAKSPNMTPNKKGKVIKAKIAGLISWYLGVP